MVRIADNMDNPANFVILGGEAAFAPKHSFRRELGFPYYTLSCMLTGRCAIRFADGEAAMPAVSLSLISPNTQYSVYVPDAHRELWIVFSPRPEWRPWLHWGATGRFQNEFSNLSLGNRRSRVKIIRGLRNALEYSQSPLPSGLRLAELALEQVLVMAASMSTNSEALDERLERVLWAMRQDLAQPWRESELAAIATLSPSRFAHLFCEKLGLPPLRYLEKLRMEKAKALLLGTACSVKEIAAMVGYFDALHFSTRFSKQFGRSPKAYRQSLASEA